MAAADLPASGAACCSARSVGSIDGRWAGLADNVEVRTLWDRVSAPPPLAGTRQWTAGAPPEEEVWRGVASEQRWAMEVLGLRAGMDVERDDVNRRFRRLLRDAHPDSGGAVPRLRAGSPSSPRPALILLDLASDGVAAEG